MKFLIGMYLCLIGVSALAADAVSTTQQPDDVSLASSDSRPLSPWVFRSVLDGQPRIVTVALHPDLYIAYDAAGASLFKAWKGEIKFDGAVYTTSHGPQPTSTGYAYYQQTDKSPIWLLKQGDKVESAKAKFGGYRFEHDQVVFQYTLITATGNTIRVEETPEYTHRNGQA